MLDRIWESFTNLIDSGMTSTVEDHTILMLFSTTVVSTVGMLIAMWKSGTTVHKHSGK